MPLPKVRQLPKTRQEEWPYGYFSNEYFDSEYFDTDNLPASAPKRKLTPVR